MQPASDDGGPSFVGMLMSELDSGQSKVSVPVPAAEASSAQPGGWGSAIAQTKPHMQRLCRSPSKLKRVCCLSSMQRPHACASGVVLPPVPMFRSRQQESEYAAFC